MIVYEMVFSPTGGTKKVSDCFTRALGYESTFLDLTDPDKDFAAFSFGPEDICIAAVPSYGGRAPQPALSRLAGMKGNGARAILVGNYGNRAYEDTFVELKDTLEKAGFSCVAGIAAIAEHSIMRQFAAGRPDEQDEKELSRFASHIRSRLEEGWKEGDLKLPGNRPYREYGGVPMKPQAGKACIRCGLCARKCPVHAIHLDAPDQTDTKACISCMRCVSVCPRKARSVSKMLLAAGSMKLKKASSEYKRNELYLP